MTDQTQSKRVWGHENVLIFKSEDSLIPLLSNGMFDEHHTSNSHPEPKGQGDKVDNLDTI